MRNIIGFMLVFSTTLAFIFTISCDVGVGDDDDADADDDAIDDDADDDTDDDTDDDVNDDADDDIDDDTDDDISWDDRCESMINEYYDECDNALFDFTHDEAMVACKDQFPPQIPWECVVECWEDTQDCALWFACIMESCDIPQPDDDVDDDIDDDVDDDLFLDFEPLYLNNCLMEDDREFVIRTQAEWDLFVGNIFGDKFWYEINFEEFMVVGVSTGAGGCAAWGQIHSIYQRDNSVDVSYNVESGGPCYCYVSLPMFAIIPKSDLPVNFYAVDMQADRDEESYSHLFLNNCLIDAENSFVIRTADDWNRFIGMDDGDNEYDSISMLNFGTHMVLGLFTASGGCMAHGQIFDIGPDWIGNYLWFSYFLQGEGACDCWVRVPIFAMYPQTDLVVDFLMVE